MSNSINYAKLIKITEIVTLPTTLLGEDVLPEFTLELTLF